LLRCWAQLLQQDLVRSREVHNSNGNGSSSSSRLALHCGGVLSVAGLMLGTAAGGASPAAMLVGHTACAPH
jgi:hypothetical protein